MPTRPSRARARSWATRPGTRRALIGPNVPLSSTDLCANRLNDWNTMPTSARIRVGFLPSSGSGLPSIMIRPLSTVSSRLMQWHSVDVPELEGLMTTTTSPGHRVTWAAAASGPATPGAPPRAVRSAS